MYLFYKKKKKGSHSCVDLNSKVDDGTEEFRCKSETRG